MNRFLFVSQGSLSTPHRFFKSFRSYATKRKRKSSASKPLRFELQSLNRETFPNLVKHTPKELNEKLKNMTFDDFDLRPEVVSAITNVMAISKPSAIQALAIPKILEMNNVFCAAETGSGKTLSYLAPLISRLRHEEHVEGVLRLPQRPRALVLVPSKELVIQVSSIAKQISHLAKVRAEGILDRKPKCKQDLQGLIDIIISTPQKFKYQLDNGVLSANDIRYVVADEADTLLEKDFGEHVRQIMATIKNCNRAQLDVPQSQKECQFIFVSATIPRSITPGLQKEFPKNLIHIVSPKIHTTSSQLKQRFIKISGHGDNKQKTLLRIMFDLPPKDESTIIFCNKLGTIKALHSWLSSIPEAEEVAGGPSKIAMFSRDLSIEERKRIIEKFQNKEISVLLCTDVASRGLDTTEAKHVILYDFPSNIIDYLHRVGRTARAGANGRATSIVSKKDEDLAASIKKTLSKNN